MHMRVECSAVRFVLFGAKERTVLYACTRCGAYLRHEHIPTHTLSLSLPLARVRVRFWPSKGGKWSASEAYKTEEVVAKVAEVRSQDKRGRGGRGRAQGGKECRRILLRSVELSRPERESVGLFLRMGMRAWVCVRCFDP
jgi:hypothetical protein